MHTYEDRMFNSFLSCNFMTILEIPVVNWLLTKIMYYLIKFANALVIFEYTLSRKET